MASDPDNPFARHSAWPQMPQAPFRVGPLPKAAPPPEAPAQTPPQTVTPVFSRPLNPQPAVAGLSPGGLITRPNPQPQLQAKSAPKLASPEPSLEAPAPPAPPEPPTSEPVAAESYVELAPVIVQPLGSERRRAATRKSPLPAVAAAGVGLAAVLGIAYALNRSQDAALKTGATPAPAVAAAPVTEVPVVAAPSVAPAAAPPARPTGSASKPGPALAAPATKARNAQPTSAPQPAAAAPAAEQAPLLTLPPAAPAVEAAPQPAYAPPTAPDPGAPMTTRRD